MTGIQKYKYQIVGISYAICVIFRLLWKFVRHPIQYVRLLAKKPPSTRPECLLDESFGTHQFIQLKDVKWHCVSKGNKDKPLMLFLHGFPDFWFVWRHQIKEFSQRYRTVAIDLKGFGDSDKPSEITAYLTSKIREDIANLVRALNYKSCILVAHDFGGTVAYHVATKFPELVDKLIILNSPHPAAFLEAIEKSSSQRAKSWYMVLFQVPYLPEILIRVFDYEFLRCMCGGGRLGSAVTDEEIQAYRYMYSKHGFSKQLNMYKAALSYRKFCDTVSTEIDIPSLIIWGRDDSFLDTELAEMNKTYLPKMKTKLLNEVGHWPHIDKADEVNTAIQDFLDEK